MHHSQQIQKEGVVFVGNAVNIIRERITTIDDENVLEDVLIQLDQLEFMTSALYDRS